MILDDSLIPLLYPFIFYFLLLIGLRALLLHFLHFTFPSITFFMSALIFVPHLLHTKTLLKSLACAAGILTIFYFLISFIFSFLIPLFYNFLFLLFYNILFITRCPSMLQYSTCIPSFSVPCISSGTATSTVS